MSGITQHEAFCVWLLSPVVTFPGFVPVVPCIGTSYCPVILHRTDMPRLICLAVDTDRFVWKPPQRSFAVLGPAGRRGNSERAGDTAVSFSRPGAPWPAFGRGEWDPKAEALQGGRPHTSTDHPLSHTSPPILLSPPRTLTGAEWEVLPRGLANLENLFAWQKPCGLGWGIKVISKSFHR